MVVTFTSAYLIDKTKGTVWLRRTAYFLSILPQASVAVINMDDAGDAAPAAAMCMLIVFANVIVRSLAELVSRRFKRKTQGWRAR